MYNNNLRNTVELFLKRKKILTPEVKQIQQILTINESSKIFIPKINKIIQKKNIKEQTPQLPDVQIVAKYTNPPKKSTVQDFINHQIYKYRAISKILKLRLELQNVMTITRIKDKKKGEQISFIGMVLEKSITKNNNIILTLEDTTGQMKVLISKNKKEILQTGYDLTFDEVIGITGVAGDDIIFANNIYQPDIPYDRDLRTVNEEVYAIHITDFHAGSKLFLKEELEQFIKWIRGELGNDKHKKIAKKVKYVFITGDLVDGVGHYPKQEEELEVKDIQKQFEIISSYLKRIPKDKTLIIIPGNHDGIRLSEPQPPFDKEFSKSIYDLPNAIILSNPAYVNIHKTQNNPGIDVLMYHGYSMNYYYTNINSLRQKGAMHKPTLISKYLLKKRHLAPTHKSTIYVPYSDFDPLVIDKVPDIIMTGDIHKPGVLQYRQTTIIAGSCWQSKTAFQEKMGHSPEPAKVPLINLQTREVKILKFEK